MTGLILLLLIAAAVVYAVFFLIFKLIWMIIKKQSNKWPFILAGVCTVLFCGTVIGGAAWGIYKVFKPFSPIADRVKNNPAPVYGQTIYTDPEYGFSLTVFDGMDFSEWIHFDGADLKLGIDTNVFKKDNAGKDAAQTVMLAALLRLPNRDGKISVDALEEGLKNNTDRRLEITEMHRMTIDGSPALYVAGKGYSNRGESVPVWLMAAEKDGYVYFVAFMGISQTPTDIPEQSVKSLRFDAQN